MLCFLWVLLSLTALQVEGFSGGGSSIASQCGSMLPGNSFHGSTGQSSSSPYTVTVNQTNYQPGDTIQGESPRWWKHTIGLRRRNGVGTVIFLDISNTEPILFLEALANNVNFARK
uniref:Reelin domain-containing protein n=1 Tax=Oncorhynchus mykiss TaxID=8022 RepID=A0A8K9V894_ONCMY